MAEKKKLKSNEKRRKLVIKLSNCTKISKCREEKNLPRRLKNKKGEKTHCIRFLPGVLIGVLID